MCHCGFPTCASKPSETPCALNTIDVGIAIGSACATASDLRVDSRVMFSAGLAAQSLNWLSGCKNVIAIPISCSSKNPFFDRKPKEKKFNFISLLIGLVIFSIFLAILLPFLSDIYQRETLKRQVAEPANRASSSMNTNTNVTSKYSCDGRVHCSQMKSYDEAVFFINNCPGTKMDGDGDGDPCEGQFR